MSQYAYNKHNTTWKVLCTVFTHSLFLYQKSYSNGNYSGTSIQRRANGLVKRVRFIKVPLSRVIAKNSRDKYTA